MLFVSLFFRLKALQYLDLFLLVPKSEYFALLYFEQVSLAIFLLKQPHCYLQWVTNLIPLFLAHNISSSYKKNVIFVFSMLQLWSSASPTEFCWGFCFLTHIGVMSFILCVSATQILESANFT